MQERDKIRKTREVLLKIAHGTNPITENEIGEDEMLNDPFIIRSLYFAADILENVLNGSYSSRKFAPFVITAEQKSRVILPEGKIGVNAFSKCINEVLDLDSKKLTGAELNKKLKQMNILSEVTTDEGKTATITNDQSHQYGFELEHRIYNGKEYDMVLINDTGKKYLMENLEIIMGLDMPA